MARSLRLKQEKRAFTLYELLIVVAILVALVALLVPGYLLNRGEKVRKSCLSHFSKVGQALLIYANDFDDSLPMSRYSDADVNRSTAFFAGDSFHRGRLMWADLVIPYTGRMDVFTCPSDTLDAPNFGKNQGFPLSFALNSYFYVQPGVNRETLTGGAVGEIANASSKILMAESASRSMRGLTRPDLWKGPDRASAYERHLGGANWIYSDIHAENHKMPQEWKVSGPVWENPTMAQEQPYPQWFPWLKSSSQSWN